MTLRKPSASLREFLELAKKVVLSPEREEEILADCRRRDREKLHLKLKESGILNVTTSEDHERFLDGRFLPTESLRVAIDWFCDARKGGPTLLALLGHVGVGKTVSAGAMLVRNQGYGVYKSMVRLVRIQGMYGYQDELDKAASASFLIIDDVGAESKAVEGRAVLQDFINARQDKRYLTVITGNLSPSEFKDRYDERTWSRIQQIGRVAEIVGTDMRRPAPVDAIRHTRRAS